MLVHFLVFIYMFITSYTIGRYCTTLLVRHLFRTDNHLHPALYSATGLGYIMVAAGFFSLFAPIGLLFNIILCLATVACYFLERRNGGRFSFDMYPGMAWKASIAFLLFSLLFVLIKSSGPVTNPDTGGYHLPFVKWTEQYPVIKGLASVHSRFGFNYQYLVLAAVYGFSFLNIPTLHATNGYIMLLLLWYVVTSMDFVRGKGLSWLDIVKLIMLFFVINMSNAMSSISPDFPASALSILVILLTLDKIQDGSFYKFDCLALLVFLLSIFAVLFKLSGLPVLLFCTVFAAAIFKKRSYLIVCLSIGMISLIPYLIRNYLISGYLIYPLYSLDLFDVPWKSPLEIVIAEKEVVKYYALGLPVGANVSFAEMIRSWLGYLRSSNPVYVYIVYLMGVCILLNIAMALYALFRKIFFERLPLILVNLFLIISLIYWFSLGPDPRFGNGYIIPFIAITLALCIQGIVKKMQPVFVYGALSVFLLLQVAMLKGAAISRSQNNKDNVVAFNLISPAPYAVPDTFSMYLKEGIKVYKTRNNTQCWDAPLPCTIEREVFKAQGEKIHDGFLPEH
ncbi:MAG: hypothetical protein EOP56_11105 [Sphingobacteriales bacterium]|nr:MAG: hypothetical protein EOP56_11105 [Sphingobacteriales bacterium]